MDFWPESEIHKNKGKSVFRVFRRGGWGNRKGMWGWRLRGWEENLLGRGSRPEHMIKIDTIVRGGRLPGWSGRKRPPEWTPDRADKADRADSEQDGQRRTGCCRFGLACNKNVVALVSQSALSSLSGKVRVCVSLIFFFFLQVYVCVSVCGCVIKI